MQHIGRPTQTLCIVHMAIMKTKYQLVHEDQVLVSELYKNIVIEIIGGDGVCVCVCVWNGQI